jgi:hypothetical protein
MASDGGLILVRDLDEHLNVTTHVTEHLSDPGAPTEQKLLPSIR